MTPRPIALLVTSALLFGCTPAVSSLPSTPSESPSRPEYTSDRRSNPSKIIFEGEEYPLLGADPDCVKGEDGYFYLFTTQTFLQRGEKGYGFDRCPILRSTNLSEWEYVGSVFADDAKFEDWDPDFGVWAPTILKVGDMYNCYYSVGYSSGYRETTGIGVAQAPSLTGPWTDYGKLFNSGEIGVENSIDPFAMEVDGHIYLYFGSFLGVYSVELTIDGLALMDGHPSEAELIEVSPPSGSFDLERNFEATYIVNKNGKYYLFGSKGTCCSGIDSSYYVVSGVSDSPFGPFLGSDGKEISAEPGGGDLVIAPSPNIAGVGHNAVVEDDAGEYWIVYHGYDKDWEYPGERTIFADPLEFSSETGMPYVQDIAGSDGLEMDGPQLSKKGKLYD